AEGFEPHGRCTNYNYWGIGVTNLNGGCGISYSSLYEGVKGLANLEIVRENETFLDLMKKYAYIGDYWYPIIRDSSGDINWGIGGCAYAPHMKDYYSNQARYNEVQGWCDAGTGGSHHTTDEDQEAYAKYNSRKMIQLDEEIFGPYLPKSSNSSNISVSTNGILSWPTPTCTTITSTYGNRESPTAGASTDHRAIDIGCEQGSNVVAAADGVVTVSDSSEVRGYYIVIKHTINGQRIDTLYQHLSVRSVSVGQPVSKGQVIGKSGGDPGTEGAGTSSGAHLHFEVHNGEFAYHQNEVNPCNYLGLSTCYGDVASILKR
ncbi:MAG: M23 family metallopeptidase, partial [Bacilli bacterium]|nr:M23 family metallopeptidase [Bacilli bacterium]